MNTKRASFSSHSSEDIVHSGRPDPVRGMVEVCGLPGLESRNLLATLHRFFGAFGPVLKLRLHRSALSGPPRFDATCLLESEEALAELLSAPHRLPLPGHPHVFKIKRVFRYRSIQSSTSLSQNNWKPELAFEPRKDLWALNRAVSTGDYRRDYKEGYRREYKEEYRREFTKRYKRESKGQYKGVANTESERGYKGSRVEDSSLMSSPLEWIGFRIYVGGLPKTCDPVEVRGYFESFGAVEDFLMPSNEKKTKKLNSQGGVESFRGFAFVTFERKEIASFVLSKLHHVCGTDIFTELALPKEKGKKYERSHN